LWDLEAEEGHRDVAVLWDNGLLKFSVPKKRIVRPKEQYTIAQGRGGCGSRQTLLRRKGLSRKIIFKNKHYAKEARVEEKRGEGEGHPRNGIWGSRDRHLHYIRDQKSHLFASKEDLSPSGETKKAGRREGNQPRGVRALAVNRNDRKRKELVGFRRVLKTKRQSKSRNGLRRPKRRIFRVWGKGGGKRLFKEDIPGRTSTQKLRRLTITGVKKGQQR